MPSRAFGAGFGGGFGGPLNIGALLLKVGSVSADPAHYQDGDVLVAINRRRTRSVFAQHVCHPRQAPRTNGRIQPDALTRHLFEETYQYRFDRVSATTVTRTNLWTSAVDVIGPTPNENGEAMDVAAYVTRRLTGTAPRVFGTEGAEFWYGGNIREAHADLDRVWTKIETHSAHREIDFPRWPFGDQELRSHLAVEVDDFDDAEQDTLAASVMDESVVVRKRARRMNWRTLPGMSAQRIAQIDDRAQRVDIRAERKHPRGLYVQVK